MSEHDDSPIVLTMAEKWLWLLRIGTAAAGAIVGLIAQPLVRWLVETIDSAPGPLRLAGILPPPWAVLVLTVVGFAAGCLLAHQARAGTLRLSVDGEGVTLAQSGDERYIERPKVAEVYLDGKELVLLDRSGRQLARNKATDLPVGAVEHAFTAFGYPWAGFADPHEDEYKRWIDGHPELDPKTHDLLRARSRALADTRPGTAADLADDLQAAGIVVRDRADAQEWRRLS